MEKKTVVVIYFFNDIPRSNHNMYIGTVCKLLIKIFLIEKLLLCYERTRDRWITHLNSIECKLLWWKKT